MIRILEVGPRDGLQNEKVLVPTNTKLQFIEALVGAGLHNIEVSSFVSPRWVPQLEDVAEIVEALSLEPSWHTAQGRVNFSYLVPNLRGLERAMLLGISRIAVFTAASDVFTEKNINMSVQQTLDLYAEMIPIFHAGLGALSRHAKGEKIEVPAHMTGVVRAYVSTAFECPYAGRIEPALVAEVCGKLMELGVDQISIGDTIGAATPKEVKRLTRELLPIIPKPKFAYHFHDTRGTAVANVAAALEDGIEIFDSSAGGLGGCPYAPGAGGNLATEDLVYFLEREGFPTGVDPEKLAMASLPVLEILGKPPTAKAQLATLARCGPV